MGPFPEDCPQLWEALEQQPTSEFQAAIAHDLQRRLTGFRCEFQLSDGVTAYVHLRKRQINEMRSRGVFRYLSRLLLSYVGELDRETRRPDTLARGLEDMAASLREIAAERERELGEAQSLELLAQEADAQARRYQVLRPRVHGGRPSSVPPPHVVREQHGQLETWLKQRWEEISSCRRRANFAGRTAAFLVAMVPSDTITADSVQTVLWPGFIRRRASAVAVALLALAYGVSNRSILYAKKSSTSNL